MVEKYSLDPILDAMQQLVGKELFHYTHTDKVLDVVTNDGKRFVFDFSAYFTFFHLQLRRFQHIQGKKIREVSLNRKNQLYIEAGEEYALIEVKWLYEDTFYHEQHENGLELFVSMEDQDDEEHFFLYFLHENEWRLSLFQLSMHSFEFAHIAKKYDFLTHPKTRLKFITQ